EQGELARGSAEPHVCLRRTPARTGRADHAKPGVRQIAMPVQPAELRCAGARDRPYIVTKSNASRRPISRPMDGEGKCAVHSSVELSQISPNSFRRVCADCLPS